jgi:hypothetical protein
MPWIRNEWVWDKVEEEYVADTSKHCIRDKPAQWHNVTELRANWKRHQWHVTTNLVIGVLPDDERHETYLVTFHWREL